MWRGKQGLTPAFGGIQIDLQLESGEYFLKPTEKKRREEQERRQKACIIFSWCIHLEPPMTWWVPQQTEAAAKRRVERAEAFVAPVEAGTATVEEKRKRKRREVEALVDGDEGRAGKKKKKKRDVE